MGDWDLLRALGLAGIRCAVVAKADEPMVFSRYTGARIERGDYWNDQAAQIERLLAFGRAQTQPPILFYAGDGELLLVSRHREVLQSAFRLVVPDRDLVDTLVDKGRFRRLAQDRDLPVPASRQLRPADEEFLEPGLRYPVLMKPLTRHEELWFPVAGRAKALRIEDPDALSRICSQLAVEGMEVLIEELVPGPESRIESYHAYVDATGEVAGEFTGRKVRTQPAEYGHSTALVTTAAADVESLGREMVRRVGLRGLVKVDFKRTPEGDLRLLELNPRFSLWHHLGARAGVNLPAIVYADLAGLPRPPHATARPGVRWSSPWLDKRAAREAGIPLLSWVAWTLRAEAKSVAAWDDPMPALRGPLRARIRRTPHAAGPVDATPPPRGASDSN